MSYNGEANSRLRYRYTEIEVEVPELFDFNWALGFLARRAVPHMEEVTGLDYRRSLHLRGQPVTLALKLIHGNNGPRALLARVAGQVSSEQVHKAVAEMFDLDAPLDDFMSVAGSDKEFYDIAARRPGIRLPVFADPFEGVVRAVLGQLVSLAAARTICGRLISRFGEEAPELGGLRMYLFPRPDVLAEASLDRLRSIGITHGKAVAIHEASRAIVLGELDLTALREVEPAAAEAALACIPGFGPWTRAYIRMRVLGDRDVFPATDLGVVKALSLMLGTDERPGTKAIESRAEVWRPWRSYATLHLWNFLVEQQRATSS